MDALDAAAREASAYVMITHHDDGVALFGPELDDPGAAVARSPRDATDTRPHGRYSVHPHAAGGASVPMIVTCVSIGRSVMRAIW